MHKEVYIQISALLDSYSLIYMIIVFINEESNGETEVYRLDSLIVTRISFERFARSDEIISGGGILHSNVVIRFSAQSESYF